VENSTQLSFLFDKAAEPAKLTNYEPRSIRKKESAPSDDSFCLRAAVPLTWVRTRRDRMELAAVCLMRADCHHCRLMIWFSGHVREL